MSQTRPLPPRDRRGRFCRRPKPLPEEVLKNLLTRNIMVTPHEPNVLELQQWPNVVWLEEV